MDEKQNVELLPIFSTIVGWGYFLAWSISFYPQAILNWQRKSVQGLSMDFVYYNIYGFLCYWVFNMSFYFSESIKDEYKERNSSRDSTVRFNDVMFASHALLISSFTLSQTFYYKRDSAQQLSKGAKYFITLSAAGVLLAIFVKTLIGQQKLIMWIDILYFLSYIKLIISLIKYIPQAYLNYKRQSTIGWSIHNILLDFTGGLLSITQLFLDAFIDGEWSKITGNPAKLGLGLLSISFDILFIVQHYVLYSHESPDVKWNTEDEERRRLISENQVPSVPI
ncbi:PQ loop repeat-domain-containing protein [Mycotypha africana]|uniref:PQ loop repeat-domain-containing protein n=1 Tax=Mycotypha africana TaxID=64632 RepID=UPI0023003383|nr:PQ loop repeat-domain-containing protein [Mycotypha africana]KAI8977270.1 PQ loop repeat-domain-containing protein [Mycotypha africana]